MELYRVNLARTTAYHIEEDPTHAGQVSRVLQCVGELCAYDIVEYGPHVDPSTHPDGLPEATLDKLRDFERRVPIVGTLCEKHEGGKPYDRYGPTLEPRKRKVGYNEANE